MSEKPIELVPFREGSVPCPARPAPVSLEICEQCEHVTAIAVGANSFVACRPPAPTPATPAPSPARAWPKKRILVIDANRIARSALAELLVDEGYDVKAVPTVPAGVRALADFPADLVLTDLELPGDQASLLKEAVGRASPSPAIVWMVVRNAADGATFVIKPIGMPELLHTLERALAGGH